MDYRWNFVLPSHFDIHEMLMARDQLKLILEDLIAGKIQKSEDIEHIIKNIINTQRPRLDEWIPEGSWVLIPGPKVACESDAKWDLYDSPSLYAVGILTYSSLHYPDVVKKIPEITESIRKGLDFLAVRNFHGHGYDYEQTGIDWMEALHKGEIIKFAAEHPYLSPKFSVTLNNKRDFYINSLKRKKTKGGFGNLQDFKRSYEQVLPYFNPLNSTQMNKRGTENGPSGNRRKKKNE